MNALCNKTRTILGKYIWVYKFYYKFMKFQWSILLQNWVSSILIYFTRYLSYLWSKDNLWTYMLFNTAFNEKKNPSFSLFSLLVVRYTIMVYFTGNDNQKLYSVSAYVLLVFIMILWDLKSQRDETQQARNIIWNVAWHEVNDRASNFVVYAFAIHSEKYFLRDSKFIQIHYWQMFLKTNRFWNLFHFGFFELVSIYKNTDYSSFKFYRKCKTKFD